MNFSFIHFFFIVGKIKVQKYKLQYKVNIDLRMQKL